MAIARPRRGGNRFNDEIVQLAMLFGGLLLVLFFVLVIRLYFDRKDGRSLPAMPVRSAGPLIREILEK